jgi:hypothetical protein
MICYTEVENGNKLVFISGGILEEEKCTEVWREFAKS